MTIPFHRPVATAVALLVLTAGATSARAAAIPGGACPGRPLVADPLELYGDRMDFTVYRNGTPVGRHTVGFTRQGPDLLVDTTFSVDVKLLFVTAYSFRYVATDRWRDGCLVDMQVAIDDDGTPSTVTARVENDTLKIVGPAGSVTGPAELYPTHHWNAGVIGSEVILNTITGKVGAVRMIDRGSEQVLINGQMLPATRYAYTGDLQNEVWYDPQGRWVKMQFNGKDGSSIEYRCDRCARSLTASR